MHISDISTPQSLSKLLNDPGDLAAFAAEVEKISAQAPQRINADPEEVERGLSKLVLTLIELLRQLMERQALRRIEAGSLSDEEIERLGLTFMRLEARMEELKTTFGLQDEDLNINLGPLGNLL
jgi:erythromycin esterase-like protein